MLNQIVIMGRLTRDPDLRYTQSQVPVASFTLAVDRDFGGREGEERQTDFLDCVAWRQIGEFVSKCFSKGSMAVVSGRLQLRDFVDRSGNKRRIPEIVVEHIYFGESKRSREEPGAGDADSSFRFSGPQDVSAADFSDVRGKSFSELYDADGELLF